MAAGLLSQSLTNVLSVPLGFEPRNVLSARISWQSEDGENAAAYDVVLEGALERILGLPGVQLAGLTSALPPTGDIRQRPVSCLKANQYQSQGWLQWSKW